MKLDLKYGCNPQQKAASASPVIDGRSPLAVLQGTPSYINLLDALNAWQLVSEARRSLDIATATSFKHVSPAGAALGVPLAPDLAEVYGVNPRDLTGPALAYVRARATDPRSSYGDFIAISEPIDIETAKVIASKVADGIIAPGYEPPALALL